jgi:hypothetical protein
MNDLTNVEYMIVDDDGPKLQITVAVDEIHGLSKSGKTEIIGTSKGNVKIPAHESGIKKDVYFGLNVFKYPDD